MASLGSELCANVSLTGARELGSTVEVVCTAWVVAAPAREMGGSGEDLVFMLLIAGWGRADPASAECIQHAGGVPVRAC